MAEFLYPNDWSSATVDEFIPALNGCLTWFKEKRIKGRLGYKSPADLIGVSTK